MKAVCTHAGKTGHCSALNGCSLRCSRQATGHVCLARGAHSGAVWSVSDATELGKVIHARETILVSISAWRCERSAVGTGPP